MISDRLKVRVEDLKNIVIWGNHSLTQVPDVNNADVLIDGQKKSVREAVKDDKYLNEEFMSRV